MFSQKNIEVNHWSLFPVSAILSNCYVNQKTKYIFFGKPDISRTCCYRPHINFLVKKYSRNYTTAAFKEDANPWEKRYSLQWTNKQKEKFRYRLTGNDSPFIFWNKYKRWLFEFITNYNHQFCLTFDIQNISNYKNLSFPSLTPIPPPSHNCHTY